MSNILCRVCLGNGATISIFENENKENNDVTNMLNVCLGEQIQDLPGYPRSICKDCYDILNKAVSFINKYKESCFILETRLKSVIKEEESSSFDCSKQVKHEMDDVVDKTENVKSELPDIEDNEIANDDIFDIQEPADIPVPKNKNHVRKMRTTKILSSKKSSVKCSTNNSTDSALQKKIAVICNNGEISIKSSKSANKKICKSNQQKCGRKNTNKKKIFQSSKKKEPLCVKYEQEQQLTSNKPPVLCEHCGKSFKDKVKLQLHIARIHTEKKALECPECKKIYTSEYALSRHKKRIHPKNKKLCSECGKAFSVNSDLQKHYTAVHLKIRKYKMHPCKFCGKEYITAKSLLVHERSVHTGERPAVCTVCDARFVHDEYLTQHMRLHTGETPFKCPICARGYAQSGNMKSHIKHNHSISQLDELTLKSINPRYLKFMKP